MLGGWSCTIVDQYGRVTGNSVSRFPSLFSPRTDTIDNGLTCSRSKPFSQKLIGKYFRSLFIHDSTCLIAVVMLIDMRV